MTVPRTDRAVDELRPVTIRTGCGRLRGRFRPDRLREDRGALHREHRESRAAFPRRSWARMGDGGVRDAPPRDLHPHAARVGDGKDRRPNARITRLIGRSLRAVVDLKALGERTVTIDCDVLQADAGTRTAAITGGYVALVLALRTLVDGRTVLRPPVRTPVAAVSVGIVDGQPRLDLDYREDSAADVDANVVMMARVRSSKCK